MFMVKAIVGQDLDVQGEAAELREGEAAERGATGR
jgi:hypothetical protein